MGLYSPVEAMEAWNPTTQAMAKLKAAQHLLFLAQAKLPINDPIHQRIEAFLQEKP